MSKTLGDVRRSSKMKKKIVYTHDRKNKHSHSESLFTAAKPPELQQHTVLNHYLTS